MNRTLKICLKLLVMLGLIGYLVFAFIRFNESGSTEICTKDSIYVADTDRANFVTVEDIRQILQTQKLNPKGKDLKKVNLGKIKQVVESHQFVANCICYSQPDGVVVISVTQKLPVLKIMPLTSNEYYTDIKGNLIKNDNYSADLIVVTGYVNYKRHKSTLATFAQIVTEDEFWNDMIEQINFTKEGKIELTPRIGDHIVDLGKPENLGKKLARLKTFYQKVINEVGWDKYIRISMEYNNQVVCTKKE